MPRPSGFAGKPCRSRPDERYFLSTAGRYAPALFLEVLAFWLVLRWFLFRRAILLVGWLLGSSCR